MKADGLEEPAQRKTGLVIDAYFSGTKVAWMLKNVPGLRERAERADETNASRTMLFNVHTREWDEASLGCERYLVTKLSQSRHLRLPTNWI